MFGIYKYENGLQFTGKIAKTKAEAEAYLGKKYGQIQKVYTGNRDEKGCPIYKNEFVPQYNKDAFVIQELELV